MKIGVSMIRTIPRTIHIQPWILTSASQAYWAVIQPIR